MRIRVKGVWVAMIWVEDWIGFLGRDGTYNYPKLILTEKFFIRR